MRLLVLSDASSGAKALLPALEFLDHTIATAPLAVESITGVADADVVVIDATVNLSAASHTCRAVAAASTSRPILLVVSEGWLTVLKMSWGFDDWILPRTPPTEVETRLRLAVERAGNSREGRMASVGELQIDEDTYVVRLRGQPLDLTYREFELLKYLAANPGRVFTRGQLLQQVWGYDYYGGTRTVDVHIRRLRAKLGLEYESLIGTVRGVGYKLDPHGPPHSDEDEDVDDVE
ncbi:MAG: response regulator transcription factor [Egibacteraceae bacterium]